MSVVDPKPTYFTAGYCTAFFACRSCQYLKVSRREHKHTKLLCLRNIRYFKDGHLMPTQSDDSESADSLTITFKMQKNDQMNDTVIHCRTDDSVLCPILQWARLVSQIWTYLGASLNIPVCSVWQNGRMEHITSHNIRQHLRAACGAIRSACLGFEPHEIGTHSLRSGAAMEMYLGEFPVYTPSCSLTGGQATPFFATSGSRWSISCATLQRRCWFFGLLDTFQTLPPDVYQLRTHVNATIMTMPRQGKRLDATSHNGRSCQHSPFTPNRPSGRGQTINGRNIFPIAKGAGGGENLEIIFLIPHPTSNAHLMHFVA